MRQRFLFMAIIGCLVLGLGTPALYSQAPTPEVSLDDNPNAPNNGPWIPPYLSAEDEFGLGLAASLAGFIGPSPTLVPGGPFDSDVLVPGPAVMLTFPPVPYYVDAFSTNNGMMPPCGLIFVEFSVDRATGGATMADSSWNQASLNEQPADIFRVDTPGFSHLGQFIPLPPPLPAAPPGPPTAPYTYYYGGPINPGNGFSIVNGYPADGSAGIGGVNYLLFDHTFFNFQPTMAPYPRIRPGTHDNIDAHNRWMVSLTDPGNTAIFFALHPASAANLGPGLSAADIFYCANPPGGTFWPPTGTFAPAWMMGLDTFGANTDSIDGLSVWDNGVTGKLEPGIDYVGFTLAPGSATLTALANAGFQVSAASVFMSDFQTYIPPLPAPQVPTGYFYLYLYAGDIGVGNNPTLPLPVIPYVDINVDALELTIDPDPLPYINPITKPIIDPGTKR